MLPRARTRLGLAEWAGAALAVATAGMAACSLEWKELPSETDGSASGSASGAPSSASSDASGTGAGSGTGPGAMGGGGSSASSVATSGAGGGKCSDGQKSPDETDVDCGGPCPKCLVERACAIDGDCTTGNCDEGVCACAASAVKVALPAGGSLPADLQGQAYCIDRREVTNGDYAAFLAVATPQDPPQPAACSPWKTSYEPSGGLPDGKNGFPVVNVDWCDAAMYCAWAGKRLCGTIGGGPAMADKHYSQWYMACTGADDANVYPYGGAVQPSACVCANPTPPSGPSATGSAAACEGGVTGLLDMSGNVWEWEDACGSEGGGSGPQADHCARRGGSYQTSATGDGHECLRCDVCVAPSIATRATRANDIGFRCCVD